MLWNEVYNQIIDIILAKNEKSGIIVCKYFQNIHSELLEIFYSYMQTMNSINVDLKLILITEELSFIPDNIINCCQVIKVPRPSRNIYNRCLKTKINKTFKLDEITNIKNIYLTSAQVMRTNEIICDKLVDIILNVEELNFYNLREHLYDIFIYNLNINDCIWYIIYSLVKEKKIRNEHLSNVLIKTYGFLQYYNNNYRPIYHVESYLLYLAKLIHNF